MDSVRHWVPRQADVIREAACWVILFQLIVGVSIVQWSAASARAQSQETINDRLANRQAVNENRIQTLEQLNIPARLALLEEAAKDSKESSREIRQLAYGILATLLGMVITNILSIRESRKRRSPNGDV